MRNESRMSGSGRGGEKPIAEMRRGAYRLLLHLKIVAAEGKPKRAALRRLRDLVTDALLQAGFQFDPGNPEHRKSGNESRYTIFRLPYPSRAGEAALRPEIQVELGAWPLRCPAVALPVSSFVAEAYKNPPEVATIACVSITQTAAEKFVALTRRVAAELALAEAARDPTLVRHIYDLHVTCEHYDIEEVAALAREVIPHDVEVFGNQRPEYRADPMAAIGHALQALESDRHYARQFTEFQRLMVYGDIADYADAIETACKLWTRIRFA